MEGKEGGRERKDKGGESWGEIGWPETKGHAGKWWKTEGDGERTE